MNKFLKIFFTAFGLLVLVIAAFVAVNAELLGLMLEAQRMDPEAAIGLLILVSAAIAALTLPEFTARNHYLVVGITWVIWFFTLCFGAALLGKLPFLYELSENANTRIAIFCLIFSGIRLVFSGQKIPDLRKAI